MRSCNLCSKFYEVMKCQTIKHRELSLLLLYVFIILQGVSLLASESPPSFNQPDLTPIATRCGDDEFPPNSVYEKLLEEGLLVLFGVASSNFETSPLDSMNYQDVWYTIPDTGETAQLIWIAAKCFKERVITTGFECQVCLYGVKQNLRTLCPYKQSAEQVVRDCSVSYQSRPWNS